VRIDQFVPSFFPGDAIGNHVLQVRQALHAAGFESDIYVEFMEQSLSGQARTFTESPTTGDGRVLLYHASTSSPMAEWLKVRAKEGMRLFSYYHNITPARYFERWLPEAATSMMAARRELADLAPHTDLAIAPSRFSEEDLMATGFRRTATSPLLVDLDHYHTPPDQQALARLRRRREAEGANWLFVGRVAPNKCQHDLIAAFAVYCRLFDPRSRLTLVGGTTAPHYHQALLRLITWLDLGDRVEFLDRVGHTELLAHFEVADVFVCLSEHEGFCVPVLEAMELGLPVVAFPAAAVPETVGGAGVLLEGKDPLVVACTVDALLGDDSRRAALIDAGHRRAEEFSLSRTAGQLLDVLGGAVAPA
jgi:L-malate glycosyltransferase